MDLPDKYIIVGDNLEIEISSQLYELLLIQAAEAGLTVEELIAFAFGNYMEKE